MELQMWKKMVIGAMAFSLVAGGASSAFANGKPSWAGGQVAADWDDDDDDDDKKRKGKNKVHIKLKFDDVEAEAAWALRYIAELSARGVFNGYEDGSFRPSQSISRIEAITAAVRLMGLRDEAESKEEMGTELNFRDAKKIEEKYPWAVGYVAVAVENDLFVETDNEVQPDRAADRLWATMLLVKALGLEDKAREKMNTQLDFKDAKDIPAGAVGYVAVAVERGLITGYENDTFRPNKPVTRAELAALLDRTGDQMPDETDDLNGNLSGVVTDIDASGDELTLRVNGTTKVYTVDEDVRIIRDDELVDLNDLEEGDVVLAVIVDGKITFVSVEREADENDDVYTVEGKYQGHRVDDGELVQISVTTKVNGDPTTRIFNVADDVEIIGGSAFSLEKGETDLELLVVDEEVTVITIE